MSDSEVDDYESEEKSEEEQSSKEVSNDTEEEEEDQSEENELSEGEEIKQKLDEVAFGTILKAKTKIEYDNKKQSNNKNKSKKIPKEGIRKDKNAPKEFSALVKPKKQKLEVNKFLGKKFSRDPRFDDLSGTLNADAFEKNFKFVNEMAKDYVDKIKKVKKNKKNKISNEKYELLKKQNNFVKGWLNNKKQTQKKKEVKTEINKENKKRMQQGKKQIYVSTNKINKFLKKDIK